MQRYGTRWALVLVLAMVMLPLGAAVASACAEQCIVKAWVTSQGTSADIEVKTDTPALIEVEAALEVPHQTADGPRFHDPDVRVRSDERERVWNARLAPLFADTTYHIIVRATDVHGDSSYQQGTFRTLRRTATVTFTDIRVIDDADKGKYDRGEIEFFFAVADQWLPELHQGERKIRSGKTLDLPGRGLAFTLDDAPQWIALAVQGVEHDDGLHFCSHGFPPFEGGGGGGAGKCIDFATAETHVNLDEQAGAFEFTTDDYYLKFRVRGTIDVSYE